MFQPSVSASGVARMSHGAAVVPAEENTLLRAALHAVWTKHTVPPPPADSADSAMAEEMFLSELTDTSVATVYHAIRQMPYGGVGVRRTVEGLLQARCGSCSGKHMALASLLRRLGHQAELLTLHCDFSAAVDSAASATADVPDAVAEYTRGDGPPVYDFHHVVRLTWPAAKDAKGATDANGGGSVLLDATWPDCLAPHGFRVNTGWGHDGHDAGDTLLAVPDTAIFQRLGAAPVAQLGSLKADLVATLPVAEAERRARFFRELLAWLAELQH